ncbi:MAG: energy transducer TonB [candidate division Zixibacteria bacterium]|nr:energy transducer TonB [candidate division Zixibacteria bacterium]
MQIYYQRDMLVGTCCAVAIAVLLAVWMRSAELEPRRHAEGHGLNGDTLGLQQPQSAELSSALYGGESRVIEYNHEGFLGFGKRFRVVPDGPVVTVSPPDETTLRIPHELAPLTPPSSGSNGLGAGDTTGEDELANEPIVADYIPEVTHRIIRDRPVTILTHMDPEYPFVARDAGKEGIIVAVVYIDSNGMASIIPNELRGTCNCIKTDTAKIDGDRRIIDYAIVENPPDWFFGDNFRKVFPQWRFLPKIEDGKAVSSLLTIRYTFCLGTLNCMKYELLQ